MPKVLRSQDMNKCLGCFTCMTLCAATGQQNHSIVKSAIKVRTTGGMGSNFIAVVCLGCKDPACKEVCPSDALELRDGGGVLVRSERCIGCRQCESACIMRAVNFDEETKKPIICRHCGICAQFCPHDCLQMIDPDEVLSHDK